MSELRKADVYFDITNNRQYATADIGRLLAERDRALDELASLRARVVKAEGSRVIECPKDAPAEKVTK